MSNINKNVYIGSIIILVGILALLSNFHVLSNIEDLFGGGILLLFSFIFFSLYSKDRSKWWPLLPGTIFAVIGAGVILESFVPYASDLIGASIMFAIFAVFAFVYSKDPTQWWAVIPAGIMFTLGVIVLVDAFHILDSDLMGVVFFLGLGLTFYYLWSLRKETPGLKWAIWPAAALFVLSFITYVQFSDWLIDEYVFPILLMLAGIVIIIRGQMRKNEKQGMND